MKPFKIKPIVNKINGQINFSLPRKKLSKSFKEQLPEIKEVKIKIEDWEFE